jgi:hypothetical protein
MALLVIATLPNLTLPNQFSIPFPFFSVDLFNLLHLRMGEYHLPSTSKKTGLAQSIWSKGSAKYTSENLKKEIPPRCLWCVIITTKKTLAKFYLFSNNSIVN